MVDRVNFRDTMERSTKYDNKKMRKRKEELPSSVNSLRH